MAQLYPPYIEGTLPAFYIEVGDSYMAIPFALNKAVGPEDVKSFSIKLKTIQNDVFLGAITLDSNGGYWEWSDATRTSGTIYYKVTSKIVDKDGIYYTSEDDLPIDPETEETIKHSLKGSFPGSIDIEINIGQYYKVQVAFVDLEDNVGYYSTVGVTKCTSKPQVTIAGLDEKLVNNNSNEFIGEFLQKKGGDVTEKVYSSRFIIKDSSGNEILNTGEVLHSVENNPNAYYSYDTLTFNQDLDFGKIYRISYTVTTNNNLTISSQEYLLTQQKSLYMELKGKLVVESNDDEGFVDVRVEGKLDENGNEEMADGTFLLSRQDLVKPGVWDELYKFSFNHEYPTRTIFRDFTVEQGKTYIYSLQQFNKITYEENGKEYTNVIYSDRRKSNEVFVDFNDMYLFDGKQQLKLAFNPNVTNFKTQLAETRSETIGSKYPFFFRNARIGYKTFPITALLSMRSDDNEFFTPFKDISRVDAVRDRHNTASLKEEDQHIHHHLNSENFVAERLFKLKVLDWMNNGSVKLFKSPGEGNYLVRMMETSLTPNAQLGRMLHTINSTAYECAECTHSNFVKYGIVEDTSLEIVASKTPAWREVLLDRFQFTASGSSYSDHSENLLTADIKNPYTTILRFIDLIPGTQVKIVYDSGGSYNSTHYSIITIGTTGNYFADNIDRVYGIYLLNPSKAQYYPSNGGSISYQYETPVRSAFNSITKVQTDIERYFQFVGATNDDLIADHETTRDSITKICMTRVRKRPVEYLFYHGNGNTFNPGPTRNIYDSGFDNLGFRQVTNANNIDSLYWDFSFNPDSEEKFTDKDSQEYSPFSLYIVKDSILNGESFLNHEPDFTDKTKEEDYDPTSIDYYHEQYHLFEKYYIDRIIHSQSAEETLTHYCGIYKSYLQWRDSFQEDKATVARAWMDANPLYVIDAWTGDLYKVGEEFIYQPTVTFNDEEIDLREISYYDFDDLEPEESKIVTGNGVYGEMFYQQVSKSYTFESSILTKTEYLNKQRDFELVANRQSSCINEQDLINNGDRLSWELRQAAQELQNSYDVFNEDLAIAIDNWVKSSEEEEETEEEE